MGLASGMLFALSQSNRCRFAATFDIDRTCRREKILCILWSADNFKGIVRTYIVIKIQESWYDKEVQNKSAGFGNDWFGSALRTGRLSCHFSKLYHDIYACDLLKFEFNRLQYLWKLFRYAELSIRDETILETERPNSDQLLWLRSSRNVLLEKSNYVPPYVVHGNSKHHTTSSTTSYKKSWLQEKKILKTGFNPSFTELILLKEDKTSDGWNAPWNLLFFVSLHSPFSCCERQLHVNTRVK